jgi:hypothetical protein
MVQIKRGTFYNTVRVAKQYCTVHHKTVHVTKRYILILYYECTKSSISGTFIWCVTQLVVSRTQQNFINPWISWVFILIQPNLEYGWSNTTQLHQSWPIKGVYPNLTKP